MSRRGFRNNWFQTTVLTVAPLICGIGHSAAAAELRCQIETKFSCSPNGCQAVEPKVITLIDIAAGTYARCDEKGCDKYEPTFNQSGVFLVMALPKNGLVAKLSILNGAFMEVATLAFTAVTSYGHCE